MNLGEIIGQRPDKIIYKAQNQVLKVFNENYSASNILNEALNHARIQEIGLPVPKLLEIKKLENKWVIIFEYAQGQTFDQIMNDNPQKLDEWLNKFIDIQIDIHNRKSPMLNKLKDKLQQKIDASQLSDAIKYELHTKLESMPRHSKVCHGDFNPTNVILSPDNHIYIIDWAHATQGNAGADAATTYLSFWLANNNDLAEKYLDMYCTKTNTSKKYVQEWIPIVAAARLAKINSNEHDKLLHLIDVIDFQ